MFTGVLHSIEPLNMVNLKSNGPYIDDVTMYVKLINRTIFFILTLDSVEVADLLIKSGASMSITDNYSDIPLGWARAAGK